jgi:hypothetical protein
MVYYIRDINIYELGIVSLKYLTFFVSLLIYVCSVCGIENTLLLNSVNYLLNITTNHFCPINPRPNQQDYSFNNQGDARFNLRSTSCICRHVFLSICQQSDSTIYIHIYSYHTVTKNNIAIVSSK